MAITKLTFLAILLIAIGSGTHGSPFGGRQEHDRQLFSDDDSNSRSREDQDFVSVHSGYAQVATFGMAKPEVYNSFSQGAQLRQARLQQYSSFLKDEARQGGREGRNLGVVYTKLYRTPRIQVKPVFMINDMLAKQAIERKIAEASQRAAVLASRAVDEEDVEENDGVEIIGQLARSNEDDEEDKEEVDATDLSEDGVVADVVENLTNDEEDDGDDGADEESEVEEVVEPAVTIPTDFEATTVVATGPTETDLTEATAAEEVTSTTDGNELADLEDDETADVVDIVSVSEVVVGDNDKELLEEDEEEEEASDDEGGAEIDVEADADDTSIDVVLDGEEQSGTDEADKTVETEQDSPNDVVMDLHDLPDPIEDVADKKEEAEESSEAEAQEEEDTHSGLTVLPANHEVKPMLLPEPAIEVEDDKAAGLMSPVEAKIETGGLAIQPTTSGQQPDGESGAAPIESEKDQVDLLDLERKVDFEAGPDQQKVEMQLDDKDDVVAVNKEEEEEGVEEGIEEVEAGHDSLIDVGRSAIDSDITQDKIVTVTAADSGSQEGENIAKSPTEDHDVEDALSEVDLSQSS